MEQPFQEKVVARYGELLRVALLKNDRTTAMNALESAKKHLQQVDDILYRLNRTKDDGLRADQHIQIAQAYAVIALAEQLLRMNDRPGPVKASTNGLRR